MELWIRSQNKRNLMKVEDIVAEDNYIEIYKQNEDSTRVGEYKTKERALEVLDKISKLVENAMYHTQLNNEVLFYQLPKEWWLTATLDIKLKSYDELTMEITRLNTQLLLAQKTNEDLQEMLLDKEDDLDIYKEKIRKARRFIEENSVKFGKYKVLIQEEDELAKILSEVVIIWI